MDDLQVNDAILAYATRYAVGRRTGAATDVLLAIRRNADRLGTNMAVRYAVEEGIAQAEEPELSEWRAAAAALGMNQEDS